MHANLMIGIETCSEKQVKICYVIVLFISVVWSSEFWVWNSDNQLCVAALSLKMLLVEWHSNSTAVFACLGWQVGETWFHANIKVPYPFAARNSSFLLLIFLGTIKSKMSPGWNCLNVTWHIVSINFAEQSDLDWNVSARARGCHPVSRLASCLHPESWHPALAPDIWRASVLSVFAQLSTVRRLGSDLRWDKRRWFSSEQ